MDSNNKNKKNIPCEIYDCNVTKKEKIEINGDIHEINCIQKTNTGFSESFLREASGQLTPMIEKNAGITDLGKMGLQINFYLGQSDIYIYNGDVIFAGGYNYHKATIHNKHSLVCILWIKWKMNNFQNNKAYIDEEIKQGDILFRICKKLPDEVVKHIIPNYIPNPALPYKCENWAGAVKEHVYAIKHPRDFSTKAVSKTIKKEKSGLMFDYTISAECTFPDIVIEIILNEIITDEKIKSINKTLENFISDWNDKQEKKGTDKLIHDFSLIKNKKLNEHKNNIKFHIDFGGCNSGILKRLLTYIDSNITNIKYIICN